MQIRSLLETGTDTERREKLLAARFRDTERESAGVGLRFSFWVGSPVLMVPRLAGFKHKQTGLGYVWFGFWLWLLPPKSQKPNQRAGSRKQLFLKADFLAVQN